MSTSNFLKYIGYGDNDRAVKMIEAGQDVNVVSDFSGCSAIHVAAAASNHEILRLLLDRTDVRVNARCELGQTPIALVCSRYPQGAPLESIQMLLSDPRVDTTIGDRHGSTPFWSAAFYGRVRVLELLIASGRDLQPTQPSKSSRLLHRPRA
jgi:ankyrin repeat protein